MLHWLLDLATNYGYVIVFLGVGIESMGVPIPGETALLVGAFVAGSGHLSIIGVGIAGFSGAVLGDNLGFLVGHRFGARVQRLPLIRRAYTDERLAAAEKLMARRGWMAVFFGRFVALLRIFAGPLAGMHRMPWRSFVIANATGAALWVTIVCAVGATVGSNLDNADRLLSRLGYIGLGSVVLLVAALLMWRWMRVRRRRAAVVAEPVDPHHD